FAISLSRDNQTAAETIASKGAGYGVPALQVDGNDLFAVFVATRDAVARARRGEGPTLIEALTYRIGPHTTSDDPGRYRDDSEVVRWRGRDPLLRVRLYLESSGEWDADRQAQIEEEEGAVIEQAVAEAEATEPLTPSDMFGAMFAEATAPLLSQQEILERDGP
ncbi:MAG: thiamine pyrophosphate-dependent enzyme, partial [Acidimicrobiia bacterium]|nr:thiamine pyrophosphate-dependent enzyme [Acidimicrobiia bacterium]